MRATAIPFPWRANAATVALGFAIIGLGAGLAHPEALKAQSQSARLLRAVLQQADVLELVCQARPGGWCDLRDWTGFGTLRSQFNTK